MRTRNKVLIGLGIFVVIMICLTASFVKVVEGMYAIRYTVNDSQESDHIETSITRYAEKGYKYVIVKYTLTNDGKADIDPNVYWFELEHEGRLYPPDTVTYSYKGEYRYTSQTLKSGASMTCVIIFSIPQDMLGYHLVCTPPSYFVINR